MNRHWEKALQSLKSVFMTTARLLLLAAEKDVSQHATKLLANWSDKVIYFIWFLLKILPPNYLGAPFYFISGKKQKQIIVKGLPPVGEPLVNHEIV